MTTREGDVAAAAAPAGLPAARRPAGLRNTFDFYCFEQLAAFRLPLSLRLFQLLLVMAGVVGGALLLSGSFVVAALVRALASEREGTAYALTALVCVATVYFGAGYVFREALSIRRFVVSNSPNVGFFRALDISARDVLFVYCGLRSTAYFSALFLVGVVFVVMFRSAAGLSPAGMASVLAPPPAMYLLTMMVAARAAGRRRRPEPIGWPALLLLGGVCVALGYATARFLVGPIHQVGLAGSVSQARMTTLVAVLGVVSAVVGGVSAVRLVHHVRRLGRDSFAIQQVRPARPARTRTGRGGLSLPLVLHHELVSSWAYPLLRKSFATLLTALLFGLGVLLSGASVLPVADVPGRLFTIVSAVAFPVFLGLTELILRVVGPTTFAAQFRFAWENGLSEWRIAVYAGLSYVVPVVVLAAGTSAGLWMLAGVLTTAPLSAAVTVVAAALVAESLVAPPRNVDGSAAANTVGGLLALILAVPVLVVLSFESVAGELLAAGYGLCLGGGAVACLARRTRALPSSFAT